MIEELQTILQELNDLAANIKTDTRLLMAITKLEDVIELLKKAGLDEISNN